MANRFQHSFWTKQNLEAALLAVEKGRLTGAVIHIRTGPNQETDIDPKSVDLDQLHDELIEALALEDSEYQTPASLRSGVTRSVFGD
jgi:hypothetical protein